MKLVLLESPYAGDVEANVAYARACVRDSLMRGEAPIASHLLYTQPGILDDNVPLERAWGIDAGLAWRRVAEAHVFYLDRGVSQGMKLGHRAAMKAGATIEYRWLDEQAERPKKCSKCGDERREDCDGAGWLDAIGPCADGSYITARPCPLDNPFAAD